MSCMYVGSYIIDHLYKILYNVKKLYKALLKNNAYKLLPILETNINRN